MSNAQLDFFAPTLERILVEPNPEVLHLGARASGVPVHEHVPSRRPNSLQTDDEWLGALSVAEELIRWRAWEQPRLLLDEPPGECIGGSGGFWFDAKGVMVREGAERRYARWSALLRGLGEQREGEPDVADARDLAHAYHALDQYDRFYVRGGGSVDGGSDPDWRERIAIPHLAEMTQAIAELGGDPAAAALSDSEGEQG